MAEQPKPEAAQDPERRASRAAARARAENQASWVDQQVRVAMARGDFDDLPGAGKPIEGLGTHHDPDWWLKKLVEREQVAVLPPSVQLRKDDAELDARLDRLTTEAEVRREVEEFNARVMHARYTPTPGPPLITMPREVDDVVAAWQERRTMRRQAMLAARPEPETPVKRKRRWFHR